MDQEVKQRNRRRKRAQRMQAQRENITKQRDGDSADEEIIREKPQRPPIRRKKSKEPLVEEDIIDGFAIFGFKSYDDLELVLKISSKENIKHLVEIDRPKLEPKERITHHISVHNNHGLTLTHDPATSDDSGRASERLTGSSVPPRDADSSRDRLSDASSRCSSGKGYICDSEGEDDKGSDASSVIFGSAPASRKHEFPGALPPSLPLSNGLNGSPVPAPTPPNLPAPSPAPAQLPPIHPPAAISSATVPVAPTPVTTAVLHKSSQDSLPCITPSSVTSMPPVSIQMTMPQTAAAPLAVHPPALDPSSGPGQGMRTDSPAVGTSANAAVAPGNGQQYHQPPTYQPLYAPYSVHQPYATTASATAASVPTTASVPAPSSSAVTTMATCRDSASSAIVRASTPGRTTAPSPGGRERESYSSSIRSLSRSSNSAASQPSQQLPPPLQQQSCQPPTTVSSSLVHSKPWSSTVTIPTVAQSQSSANSSSASAAPPRPTPPLHSGFPPPMFAAPLPPVSTASPHAAPVQPSAQPSQSNPFAAENLFQTNQTDMLRRELDNRFLASQDRTLGVAPPPYLRTEMHQHQHHHTHVHQHTTSLLPPPTGSSLFPSPLTMSPMDRLARRPGSSFKDIPKLGSVDSPFYRQNLAIPNYPGYTPPGLIHPGLTAGPTPFVPPTHLPTFQPKSLSADPTKPKVMKTGKWNAMHVRVAWEIYHHQQKSGEAKGSGVKTDLLRPPTHLFSPSVHSTRPHELAFPPSLTSHRPPGFDQPHPSSLFAAPSHLGKTPFAANALSPFSRYSAGFPNGPSPFAMPHFANPRDVGLGSLHDPWRNLQRTVAGFPPSVNPLPPSLPGLPPAPWTIKPDPILEQREREAREREERERERQRREREERERREREEKQRRLEQQQQEQRERERREKERREMERRELERERERERILHQQRLAAESAKQVLPSSVMRDRSPMRNGQSEHSMDIRVKEEPRIKEEDILSRTASDPRFAPHSYLRHHPLQPPPPPSVLDRSRMMASHGLHYPAPPASHWPPQHDPFYRYDPLRYNPIMDVIRAEEERVKMFGAYSPHHPSQIRTKDPSLMHLRPGPGPPPSHHLQHKMSVTPPTDLHKKEEPR